VPLDAKSESLDGAPSARVFFALWPEPALAAALAGLAGELATTFGGRPTRPETVHLTLAFLGDVATSRLSGLVALPKPAAAEPLTLHLDRLGYWPHNHLLWMGCREAPPLQRLVDGLLQQLAEAGFAIREPGRTFFPHLTLVRKLPPGSAPALPRLAASIAWPCTDFRLLASTLTAAGPAYRTLARFRLDA